MTKTVLTVLFGCLWMSFAFADEGGGKMKNDSSAPKVTREFLLRRGSSNRQRTRTFSFLEHVRLGDVAQKLGVAIECTPDWRDQKPHLVVVGDRCFYVVGEMPPADHGKVKKADIICTVSTDLGSKGLYKPAKPLLPTDGTPHPRIKSVTVPKNRKEPLQVTFDLSTDGKTPLALSRRQLAVRLFQRQEVRFRHRWRVRRQAAQRYRRSTRKGDNLDHDCFREHACSWSVQ